MSNLKQHLPDLHPKVESDPPLVRSVLRGGEVVSKRSVDHASKRPVLKESLAVKEEAAGLSLVPEGGKIMNDVALKMIPADPNADVYYTLDGTEPSQDSPKYDPLAPVAISGKHGDLLTVKAIAIDKGTGSSSPVIQAEYQIEGSLGVQAHAEREKAEEYAKRSQDEMAVAARLAAEAVEKEEAAQKIVYDARKLVQKDAVVEARGVQALQATARHAKEQFFTMLQTTKQLHEREMQLKAQCEMSDSKWHASVDAMLSANEDFDSADQTTRTVEWNGWIHKDRAQCEFKHEQSSKNQAISWEQHTKSRFTLSSDVVNQLAMERDDGQAAAQAAARAAEEGDEDNFFAKQLKEADRRQSEAQLAANAATAASSEKTAALKAAEAENAVRAAEGGVTEEQLAAATAALNEAQGAANAANEAAKRAVEHAQATKDAADRAHAAMKARGQAAVAALAALNAENHARSTVRELTLEYNRLSQESSDARAQAGEKRVKRDDEQAIALQAGKAEQQAETWYTQTVQERDDAKANVDATSSKMNRLQKEYDNAVEVERSAIDAVPIAKKDAAQCKVLHGEAKGALKKVVSARRKAWKAAYRAESGNKELKEAFEKVQQISSEEKKAADDKNAEASKMEEEQEAVVKQKLELVAMAEEMLSKAKASNDPEAEATAERSIQAANSALAAARSAHKAAVTSATAIRGSTEKALQMAQKLAKSVVDLGTSDEAEERAKAMATKANDMMRQATLGTQHTKELWEQAVEEHKLRIEDRDKKIAERKRLERELAEAKIGLSRHGRYLVRKEEQVKEWKSTLADVTGYRKQQEELHTAALKAYTIEDAKAKGFESQTADTKAKLDPAVKTVSTSHDDVSAMTKSAGLDLVAKLAHMRSKWHGIMLADAVRVKTAAELAVQQAKPDVQRATKLEVAAERARDRLQAIQDGAVGMSVSKRKGFKVVWLEKTDLQVTSKKENEILHQQYKAAAKEAKDRVDALQKLEVTRRESALAALQLRVESVWKRRQEVHDPDPNRRLEISQYEQILAAWDRDGTPVGPGVLDTWYLDPSKLTESHDGRPGYLKETVVNRCSSACAEYGDLQCSQGHRFRACTRGRVYRVRFARSATIRAKSDWFVCRCNSGVMQLASRDLMDVTRRKNQLLRASLSPENMIFDVRLHQEELLPDNHVHCFRDFEKWLTQDTPFAEKDRARFKDLDALALSPPEEAKHAYNTVRDLWYKTCLRESAPEPASAGTHIGSTDGAFDVFEMKTQPYSTMDVRQYKGAEEKTAPALELA
eukprot:TRINITY_DN11661_c0_g3_i2.p1 TRINITY_DN11661_c0_g3~~TRINITY_DN11661_c0_g3_i2.p1  ORF type:complete len:1279 (-),score=491.12 TRINITY_DN11661_c0_g3_i2:54-3890(-)